MKIFLLLAFALAMSLLTGCASTYTQVQKDTYISQAIVMANDHIAQKEHKVAYLLTSAVLNVAPDNQSAGKIQTRLKPLVQKNAIEPALMGVNLSQRAKVERSLQEKILWYLPDRYLDLLDMFSGDIRFGPGLYANMHLTRAAQIGGGVRADSAVGLFEQRCLGGEVEQESSVNLACYGISAVNGDRAGTSGVQSGRQTLAGMHKPSQQIYQDYRDYWGLGASASFVIVGASAEFHPIEIADFILGFARIDIGNDDFADTAGLNLNREDRKVIQTLNKMKR